MLFLASQLLSALESKVADPPLWHCVYTTPGGERVHGEPSYPRKEAIDMAGRLNAITENGHWTAEPRWPHPGK